MDQGNPIRNRYEVGTAILGLIEAFARRRDALTFAEVYADTQGPPDEVTVHDVMARCGQISAWAYRDGKMQPIGTRIV